MKKKKEVFLHDSVRQSITNLHRRTPMAAADIYTNLYTHFEIMIERNKARKQSGYLLYCTQAPVNMITGN